GVSKFA
nr:Chain D, POLYPEPTIDE [unidentified]